MSKISAKIWGRDFILDLTFDEYAGYVSHEQLETAAYVADGDILSDTAGDIIKYVRENSAGNDIGEKDNIFRYVMPLYIYIPVSDNGTAVVMCDFKFDIEHGIAVAFNKKGIISIGAQDSVL